MRCMKTRPMRRESACVRGQAAILFALGLTTILLMLGFGVDFGAGLAVKTRQATSLEAVSQACMEQSNAVKFSETPGDEARSQVLEILRDSRFSGEAQVWYVEAPRGESGASDRYGGTLVQLSERQRTAFLTLAGQDELQVSSSISWVTHPYSSGEVWRPKKVDGGWTRVTMKDGVIISTSSGSASIDSAPEELRSAIRDAIRTDAG